MLPLDSLAPAADNPTGYHIRRAGLGTWAVHSLRLGGFDPRFLRLRAWKDEPTLPLLNEMAADLAALIRAWAPAIGRDWIVTAPPAGASAGKPYPAGHLAAAVGALLGLDYATILIRTRRKTAHHPLASMAQPPFALAGQPPLATVLIVDDFIASGTTLRLARATLTAAGTPAFCFAWATNK